MPSELIIPATEEMQSKWKNPSTNSETMHQCPEQGWESRAEGLLRKLQLELKLKVFKCARCGGTVPTELSSKERQDYLIMSILVVILWVRDNRRISLQQLAYISIVNTCLWRYLLLNYVSYCLDIYGLLNSKCTLSSSSAIRLAPAEGRILHLM